jgi:hypothetical protein
MKRISRRNFVVALPVIVLEDTKYETVSFADVNGYEVIT